MQFLVRKRRNAPMVIIISLIDVLIVVLIFLMVTTTFKQQPAIKLALPESRQGKPGASENSFIVTIGNDGLIYLQTDDVVTLDALKQKLIEAVQQNPAIRLDIKPDTLSPVGQLLKVMDAAKEAGMKVPANIFTKQPAK